MIMKNLQDKILSILLSQLLSFSLVFALTSSLCLTYSIAKTLLIIIACVIFSFIMFYNKKTSLFSWLLIGTVTLATGIYILYSIGIKELTLFFVDYFFWLEDFIQYADIINPS